MLNIDNVIEIKDELLKEDIMEFKLRFNQINN